MKYLPLVLLLASAGAFAGFADNKPVSKTEIVCHEQSTALRKTMVYYRNGESEQSAYDKQVSPDSAPRYKKWLKYIIHDVYSDPKTAHVDPVIVSSFYEDKCIKNPSNYVRDKRLIE